MKRLIDRMLDMFARRFGRGYSEDQLDPAEERWQAGDVAECILDDPWRMAGGQIGIGPAFLEVRAVTRVKIAPHAHTGEIVQFLVFARYGSSTYEAIGFRKLQPRRDSATPAADAFLRQLHDLNAPLESEMS